MFDEERPRVEEVYFVHHDDDDAVAALQPPRLRVLDVEHVAERVTMVIVSKEDGAFSSLAHLVQWKIKV